MCAFIARSGECAHRQCNSERFTVHALLQNAALTLYHSRTPLTRTQSEIVQHFTVDVARFLPLTGVLDHHIIGEDRCYDLKSEKLQDRQISNCFVWTFGACDTKVGGGSLWPVCFSEAGSHTNPCIHLLAHT